jgi:hypothetical protein
MESLRWISANMKILYHKQTARKSVALDCRRAKQKAASCSCASTRVI